MFKQVIATTIASFLVLTLSGQASAQELTSTQLQLKIAIEACPQGDVQCVDSTRKALSSAKTNLTKNFKAPKRPSESSQALICVAKHQSRQAQEQCMLDAGFIRDN